MEFPKYRYSLPQLSGGNLLTDGGIETTLIFQNGLDLPYFAAFTLLRSEEGRAELRRYYRKYIQIAHQQNIGFILDSAIWRASTDWGLKLGYDAPALADANRQAINLLFELRRDHEKDEPFVVSGNIGPRGDGYVVSEVMSTAEAEDYHSAQVSVFEEAGVDMVSALTMTHTEEAKGIAKACAKRNLPFTIAFTVETDGRLPSGQHLADAINELDSVNLSAPSYYMINCAHPDHFRDVLVPASDWTRRIWGLRANASRMSHEELDSAQTLDDGDPRELAQDYETLLPLLPNLRVFGGCCGTDHRHVRAIGQSCVASRLH